MKKLEYRRWQSGRGGTGKGRKGPSHFGTCESHVALFTNHSFTPSSFNTPHSTLDTPHPTSVAGEGGLGAGRL